MKKFFFLIVSILCISTLTALNKVRISSEIKKDTYTDDDGSKWTILTKEATEYGPDGTVVKIIVDTCECNTSPLLKKAIMALSPSRRRRGEPIIGEDSTVENTQLEPNRRYATIHAGNERTIQDLKPVYSFDQLEKEYDKQEKTKTQQIKKTKSQPSLGL